MDLLITGPPYQEKVSADTYAEALNFLNTDHSTVSAKGLWNISHENNGMIMQ